MKKIFLLLITTVSILMMSCGSGKQKLQTEIDGLEQKLRKDPSALADKQKAADMIHLYLNYADQFQDDSMSAEYLFRAADITNGIKQPEKAIALYERVLHYQNYTKTPIALFLQGFISETELQNMNKAKEYYEKFLKQYPNHKLASDVQVTLSNLGKTPEELIKEFEARAKGDSMAVK